MPILDRERIAILRNLSRRSIQEGRVIFPRPILLPDGNVSRSAVFGQEQDFASEEEDRAAGYEDAIMVSLEFLPTANLNTPEESRLMVLNASINLEREFDLEYVTIQFPDSSSPTGFRDETAFSQLEAERSETHFDPLDYEAKRDFFDECLTALKRVRVIDSPSNGGHSPG